MGRRKVGLGEEREGKMQSGCKINKKVKKKKTRAAISKLVMEI